MFNKKNIFTTKKIACGVVIILIAVTSPRILHKVIAGDTQFDLSVLMSAATEKGGSTVGTNEEITYTLTYNNIGPDTAGIPYIEGTIPGGTCFVVNSPRTKENNFNDILYSNNNKIDYTYTPAADSRGVDCAVTHVKFPFKSLLPFPANFVSIFNYEDFQSDQQNNHIITVTPTNLGGLKLEIYPDTALPSTQFNLGSSYLISQLSFKDVNNDGYLDILGGNSTTYGYDGPVIMTNAQNRSFSQVFSNLASAGGAVKSISADFNNDGIADIVTAFMLNSRCGMSSGITWVGSDCIPDDVQWPHEINTFKLNNDSSPDIIMQYGYASAALTVYRNNGSGAFTHAYDFSFPTLYNFTVIDVNKDGYDDIIITTTDGTASLMINNQNNTFSKVTGSTGFEGGAFPFSEARAYDFNEDGYDDVLFNTSNGIMVWLNNQNGGFVQLTDTGVPSDVRNSAIALFDNDNHLDLIYSIYDANTGRLLVYVAKGDGTGHFAPGTYIGFTYNGIIDIDTGDINGDGFTDIVVNFGGGGTIMMSQRSATVYESNMLHFQSMGYADQDYVQVKDLDNDGYDDIISISQSGSFSNINVYWGDPLGYKGSGDYHKKMIPASTNTGWQGLRFTAEIPQNTSATYTLLDSSCSTPIEGFTDVTVVDGTNTADISSLTDLAGVCIGFHLATTVTISTPAISDIIASYNSPTNPTVSYKVRSNANDLPDVITASAEISADSTDSNSSNNTTSLTLTAPHVDLTTVVRPITRYAQQGETVEIDYTFSNTSQISSVNLDALITIPSQVASVSSIQAGKSSKNNDFVCSQLQNTIKCNRTTSLVNAMNPSVMYTLSAVYERDPYIYKMNSVTGENISQVLITHDWGEGYNVTGGTGMKRDPTTGTIYAMIKLDDTYRKEPPTLATIDLDTGAATRVCTATQRFSDIAFDSAGNLYGSTGPGGNSGTVPDKLSSINKTTCEATPLMDLPHRDDGSTIEFNPDDGYLYHMSGDDRILDKIDLNTKVIVSSIETEPNPYGNPASALVYMGNNTFMFDSWEDVFTVTTSGTATYRFSSPNGGSKGIVFEKRIAIDDSGELSAGESFTVKVFAQLATPLANDTTVTFVSDITNSLADSVSSDNHSQANITIKAYSELSFDETTQLTVSKGKYTVNAAITNNGTDISSDTTLLVGFPVGASYDSGASTISNCQISSPGILSCPIGDIPIDGKKNVSLVFTTTTVATGIHIITLELQNSSLERNIDNNTTQLSYVKLTDIATPPKNTQPLPQIDLQPVIPTIQLTVTNNDGGVIVTWNNGDESDATCTVTIHDAINATVMNKVVACAGIAAITNEELSTLVSGREYTISLEIKNSKTGEVLGTATTIWTYNNSTVSPTTSVIPTATKEISTPQKQNNNYFVLMIIVCVGAGVILVVIKRK